MSEGEFIDHTVAALPPGFRSIEDLRTDAHKEKRSSAAMVGVGLATAAAGVVLKLIDRRREVSPAVTIGLMTAGVGALGMTEARDHLQVADILEGHASEGVEIIPGLES